MALGVEFIGPSGLMVGDFHLRLDGVFVPS